jgi:hypothetical protein
MVGAHMQELFQAVLSQRIALFPLHNCCQLFGVDFLLDKSMHLHLLEVNASPSLSIFHSHLQEACRDMLQDVAAHAAQLQTAFRDALKVGAVSQDATCGNGCQEKRAGEPSHACANASSSDDNQWPERRAFRPLLTQTMESWDQRSKMASSALMVAAGLSKRIASGQLQPCFGALLQVSTCQGSSPQAPPHMAALQPSPVTASTTSQFRTTDAKAELLA